MRAPRPPLRVPEELRRIGRWSRRDWAYMTYWQASSAATRSMPGDFRSGDGRPVLVIPGVYENWQFMRPLIDALHADGHPVHVVPALRHNRRPVQESARRVGEYLAEYDLRRVAIVAHSKGGLIGKLAMLTPGTAERIERMVAICSPFSGSAYARLAPVPSLRAFSPRDATTLRLARQREVNERITSIFGRWDPLIPAGSELPGARNIRVDSGGHFRLIAHRTTVRIVLDTVR